MSFTPYICGTAPSSRSPELPPEPKGASPSRPVEINIIITRRINIIIIRRITIIIIRRININIAITAPSVDSSEVCTDEVKSNASKGYLTKNQGYFCKKHKLKQQIEELKKELPNLSKEANDVNNEEAVKKSYQLL